MCFQAEKPAVVAGQISDGASEIDAALAAEVRCSTDLGLFWTDFGLFLA